MTWLRGLVAAAVVAAALVLQVSFFPHLAWHGIGPDLCLLVVVGAALARGPQFAMVLGFFAGVALDLAPPADHLAGRWALALVVVGYVAGHVLHRGSRPDVRRDARPTTTSVIATVAASSFVGTSVFALSGIVLGDPIGIPELLQVILVALLWDVLLTPFVLPPVMALFRRLEPSLG